MKNFLMIAALMTTLLFANESNAQGQYAQGNIRRSARIQHGVRNGSLTRYEARHLSLQQAKVRHYHQMAMADGIVTPQERRMIHAAEARNSRNIYLQKHDRQVRRY